MLSHNISEFLWHIIFGGHFFFFLSLCIDIAFIAGEFEDGQLFDFMMSNDGFIKNLQSHFRDSKPVTCLAFDADGVLLVSGYEDGVVRVWDTKSHNIVRVFKHAKGISEFITNVTWLHFRDIFHSIYSFGCGLHCLLWCQCNNSLYYSSSQHMIAQYE